MFYFLFEISNVKAARDDSGRRFPLNLNPDLDHLPPIQNNNTTTTTTTTIRECSPRLPARPASSSSA